MVQHSEEVEEDVEKEERVRTYSRTADNYWFCQTTSVMSAFQPSAPRRTSCKAPAEPVRDRQKQGQTQEGRTCLRFGRVGVHLHVYASAV